MTQEFTEPHYKDHDMRGGLKPYAMFSTDAMGRNTLELVYPELRKMDTDTAEGFLEIAKDHIRETMSAMRKASPDTKLDCYLIAPRPGYKLDRITLKGDNARLLEIAHQYGELHMAKEPNYKATQAFKAISNENFIRDVEYLAPNSNVTFAVQIKPQYRHKSQTDVTDMINTGGKSVGVSVEVTRAYDTGISALYINGPLEHVANIATQFGSRCAPNIKGLTEERSLA